jgi:hypothetical protein
MAVAPAVATALLSLVTASRPEQMWGIPMFTFSGLLVVMLLRREWSDGLVHRLWVASVSLVAVVGIAFTVSIAASRMTGNPVRNAWPMAEVAAKARAAWASHTGAPLQVVAGENWLAGLISVGGPGRPHVPHDGFLARSPWLSEKQLRKDGVLYVWFGKKPPEGLIPQGVTIDTTGTFEVTGVRERYRTVNYAIRLPTSL